MSDLPFCSFESEHHPLGALLPDDHIAAFADLPLFAADPAVAIPATWALPGTSAIPVLDQGSLPWCEAFTDDELIGWFDTRAGRHYRAVDRASAYRAAQRIDGLPMPHDGTTDVAALTIAKAGIAYADKSGKGAVGAWSRVSPNVAAIKAAMVSTAHPVPFSVKWPHSWFHPSGAVMPKPDYTAGGHRLLGLVSWRPGLCRIRQTWGADFADGGEFEVADEYLDAVLWGAQVVAPPVVAPTVRHHMAIAAGTTVYSARLDASHRLDTPWTQTHVAGDTGTPCSAPVIRLTNEGTPVRVAYVGTGMFHGQWVEISAGVSVTEVQ